MGDSILIGQYMETNSVFHRLDPRTKLVSVVMIMASFMLLKTGISYAVATMFVFGMMILSKVPPSVFWKGLKPVLFILMFAFLYNALTARGTVLWSWSYVAVTVEGLQTGARFVWRIVLLVLTASMLTLTTKPLTLALGLEKLLSPLSKLKLPVEQLSLMIVIAIRFVPTILQELDRIILAQKARGFDISALPLPKRIFAYVPILVPLLYTTVQRAEQLTYAIDARAYGNGKGRTVYRQLAFQKVDIQAGIAVILLAVTLWILNMGGM